MAVTGHLYKLSYGGPLFTLETWSCNMHIVSTDPMTETASDFETALTAWFISSTACNNVKSKLAWIKFNEINPVTGKYLSETEADTHFLVTPAPGVGAMQESQLSLCVSFITEAARGYASKGRVFPPSGTFTLDGLSGQVTAAAALSCAQAMNSLVTTINGFGQAKVHVFSKTGQTSRQVTGIRVGRILDTQRRRRSQLVEDYQVQMQA